MKHLFDDNMFIPHLMTPLRENPAERVVIPVVPLQSASLENHVKLQQHQEEFLAWLELQDDQGNKGNSYSFRKIR